MPVRRAPGLGRLARAGAVAGPVLRLHAEPERRRCSQYTDARGGLQHRRLHHEGEALHPPQRPKPETRSSSSSATRRRTAAAAASPGGPATAAAVPAPRHLGDAEGQVQGHAAAVVQRGATSPTSRRRSPSKAPLTPGQISDTLRKRRCAWESLLAVDESVGALHRGDRARRDRANTYVFFLSDNGFLRGEHRIRDNKRYLYEESARVPFIARGPGIPHGESSDDVVVNADLTSTILELSGASPGLVQDGQSLMPSLAEPEARSAAARSCSRPTPATQILGVRTSRYLYTEWDGGKRRLPETRALRHLRGPVPAQQPRRATPATRASSPSSATSSTS